MKSYVYCLIAALLGTAIAWGQDRGGPLDRPAVEDGVEVLTRGPVHEAFAGTITFDPEPGVIVLLLSGLLGVAFVARRRASPLS